MANVLKDEMQKMHNYMKGSAKADTLFKAIGDSPSPMGKGFRIGPMAKNGAIYLQNMDGQNRAYHTSTLTLEIFSTAWSATKYAYIDEALSVSISGSGYFW